MNKQRDIEFSKELAWKIDLVLLAVHVCLLLFFATMNITLMVFVNIFSISVYAIMLPVSQRKSFLFLVITFVEIFIHMILAVICVGWDFGFQFYCFSLIPVSFLCDYFSRSNHGKSTHPITYSVFIMVSFFILRIYTWFSGALYQVDSSFVVLFGSVMNAMFIFIFLIFFMANYEKMTIQTEHVASKDELTGLNNRHKMRDIMQVVLERKGGLQEIVIAMIDIDDFKKVNDTYGHNIGDVVLVSVAQKIADMQDDSIHVCRWGGEEFLIMSSGPSSYSILQDKLIELVKVVGKTPICSEGHHIFVTITIGASCKKETENIDETISRADKYLYEGKLSGKNKLVARDEVNSDT